MKTSVVIVTYGQWALTERCLRSLEAALGERLGRDWEIVVVDNSSPDETPQRLGEWSDRVRIELQSENLNFAGGCNLGAELAHGETLIFLNNDTTVVPGALEALAAETEEPGIGAAGCRLLFPDSTIQHAGVAFYRNPKLGRAPMPQHVFHHQASEIPATRAVFEVDSVTAACFAVRRDAFFEVGGYETGYVNGLEDIDLCLKLRVAGHGIVYRGDIEITHYEGASRGSGQALFATPEKLATMAANDRLFISRWAAQLEQDDVLAERVWDAELRDGFFARDLTTPASLTVFGQPTGLGPGADEARALLVALNALGHHPAAVDLPNPNVAARLSGTLALVTERAMRTHPVPDTPVLCIPAGPSDILYLPGRRTTPGADALVRLGTANTALDMGAGPKVLAASSAVGSALIGAGMPSDLVFVMPPPLWQRPLGAGGGGLLVVLPTHDRALTATLLAALREVGRSCPMRLLPTAFDRRLAGDLREILPQAELLTPCSDEERFAAMAAGADVVLAADLTDPFERAALVAASVGTPGLSLNPGGPVCDVLGAGAIVETETLAQAVQEALVRSTDRHALQQEALAACTAEILTDLL
jgi:GT2 family glycosyltransferase